MIYLNLFINFFKIGLFTFGGGYAMIPMIQELVLSNKWMDTKHMVDFIAISETTPGPLAINMSTYVGYEVAGIPGAICSTFAVALPSFIVIILVARAYKKFKDNKVVVAVMNGIKPAVVGLVGAAVLSVAGNVFTVGNSVSKILTSDNLISLIIVITSAVMAIKKKNPVIIICIGALLGIILKFAESIIM